MTSCADCGAPIPPKTGRGRPRKYCPECSPSYSHWAPDSRPAVLPAPARDQQAKQAKQVKA